MQSPSNYASDPLLFQGDMNGSKKTPSQLKTILKGQRVKNLVKSFVSKLRRNTLSREVPSRMYEFGQDESPMWTDMEGITLN